jgi:hypothetical protein
MAPSTMLSPFSTLYPNSPRPVSELSEAIRQVEKVASTRRLLTSTFTVDPLIQSLTKSRTSISRSYLPLDTTEKFCQVGFRKWRGLKRPRMYSFPARGTRHLVPYCDGCCLCQTHAIGASDEYA